MDAESRFLRRRLVSLAIAAGYSLVGGVEFVVVLPTCWNYLQSLGVTEEYWLGFAMSGYSFAAAVFGVLVGRLADVYVNYTKMMVLISILVRVFANFQYAAGISVWNILCSRIICGLGTSAGTAILAEICRITTTEERTPFLAINNAMFQLGVLIGPAFQLFFSYFTFTIWGFQVTPLNAAGVYTGIIWIGFLLVTIFFFFNLAEEFQEIERIRQGPVVTRSPRNESESSSVSNSPRRPRHESITRSMGELMQSSLGLEDGCYSLYKEEFLTDNFILLLSLVFIEIFCVAGIETVVPVITQEYFGYSVFENSLIYMGGGLEALLFYFSVGFIGKYTRETTLLVVGWVIILFSLIWLMVVIPIFQPGNFLHVIYFLIGTYGLYLGNPIGFVSATGLLSKVLSNETQGLGQGFCRLALYLGLIYGPSWAGCTIMKPFLYLGVCIAVMLLNGVMLAMSFPSLRRAEENIRKVKVLDNHEVEHLLRSEATPLLMNQPQTSE